MIDFNQWDAGMAHSKRSAMPALSDTNSSAVHTAALGARGGSATGLTAPFNNSSAPVGSGGSNGSNGSNGSPIHLPSLEYSVPGTGAFPGITGSAFVEQPPMSVQNPPVNIPQSFAGSFDPSVPSASREPPRLLFTTKPTQWTQPPQPQQTDEIFTGASNVISDLNEMIQHFDFHFGGFNGDSPVDDSIDNSNKHYIKRLAESLKSDYTTPKSSSSESSQSLKRSPDSKESEDDFRVRLAYPPPPLSVMVSDSVDRFDYLSIINDSVNESDLIMLARFYKWSPTSSHINYLKIFITKIHMNMLPFTTCFLDNAYINCFLFEGKGAPYLLFAMLAVAARFEIYQVNRSGKPEDPAVKDRLKYHRKFRSYYLSSCLKSLDTIMHSKSLILDNIESLLLTIQVLACDYSGTRGSEWRAHLKGAKDLLIKYCKFRPISLELVIVWLWFYAMEILAGLTAYDGGTIHDFQELQEFLGVVKSTNADVGISMRKFGFLFGGYHVDDTGNPVIGEEPHVLSELSRRKKPDHEDYIVVGGRRIPKLVNFNLYLGYNDDVMDVFNDIVVALECIRQWKTSSKDERLTRVLNRHGNVRNEYLVSMMTKISKARSFQMMNNQPPFRIPPDSPYHPLNTQSYHYNNPTGANVVMSGYIHNTNTQTSSANESENWYSCFDLSQQLYTDASLLRILVAKQFYCTDGMSIKSSMVQDVVERMLRSLQYLVQYKSHISEEDMSMLDDYYNVASNEDHDEGPVDEEPAEDSSAVAEIDKVEIDKAEIDKADLGIEKEHELETAIDGGKLPFEKYLYYQFDNRLVMMQWPLYICGLCCIEPIQKLVIDCCFNALMSLGVSSSEIMLAKVNKFWRLQKLGEFDYEKQDLFDDGSDSVPFL